MLDQLRELQVRYLQRDSPFDPSMIDLLRTLLLQANKRAAGDFDFVRDGGPAEVEDAKLDSLASILGVDIEVTTLYVMANGALQFDTKLHTPKPMPKFEGIRELRPLSFKVIVSLLRVRGTYFCAYKRGYLSDTHPIITCNNEMKASYYELVPHRRGFNKE